uniref:DUF6549 family protein n=1 Tax=Alistipes sp. TaxID=1872444 RepID=UPI004055E835
MKKFLLIYAMGATLLAIACGVILHRTHREVARLRNNNEALTTETTLYRTRLDESAASVVALQHKLKEYREQHAHDTKRIKALGVRLRRVESIATAASQTKIETVTPLHDTIFLDRLLPDTTPIFRWSDNWVRIEGTEGTIRNGNAECYIESIDTLQQVIHRVPHKFLFFRYGTKAIRQEIFSSNPHTRIVYTEYIELPKRYRRR